MYLPHNNDLFFFFLPSYVSKLYTFFTFHIIYILYTYVHLDIWSKAKLTSFYIVVSSTIQVNLSFWGLTTVKKIVAILRYFCTLPKG